MPSNDEVQTDPKDHSGNSAKPAKLKQVTAVAGTTLSSTAASSQSPPGSLKLRTGMRRQLGNVSAEDRLSDGNVGGSDAQPRRQRRRLSPKHDSGQNFDIHVDGAGGEELAHKRLAQDLARAGASPSSSEDTENHYGEREPGDPVLGAGARKSEDPLQGSRLHEREERQPAEVLYPRRPHAYSR
jgi:hypothetical protein